MRRYVIINDSYKIICATASSQQIANNFDFTLEEKPEIISLDHISILDLTFSDKIKKGDNVILVCDVLSTGYITNLISTRLNQLGAKLKFISVLVDAYDENFEPNQQIEEHRDKIFSVLKRKMIKYRRKAIKHELSNGTLGVIRINPFTNTPIEESVYDSPINNRVLIDNDKFISLIDEKHVKAGYYKFNNLIHPYFFDMDGILQDTKIAKALIFEIFSNLNKNWNHEPEIIFYPKGSAIHKLDFDILKSEVFKNHSISIFELERFQTNEGWRFPHPPKYMFSIAQSKKH
ncbi:hypothetical protein [Sphingobacterium sp. IITKGP-BTPF85]|uniref:hypothetical protein n=1 Tax=Sphingobacterium sp. IITKGP-BTPF85 TaxID=1338009 RepID=UPI000389FE1B|nr:hypothetical protein [Sphingobacterium sp. IITKGP-BTPF85]KKX48150.1 hypothetical protein L950_0222720 [Sphingobacterium sp. IITKGP-BTPF85]